MEEDFPFNESEESCCFKQKKRTNTYTEYRHWFKDTQACRVELISHLDFVCRRVFVEMRREKDPYILRKCSRQECCLGSCKTFLKTKMEAVTKHTLLSAVNKGWIISSTRDAKSQQTQPYHSIMTLDTGCFFPSLYTKPLLWNPRTKCVSRWKRKNNLLWWSCGTHAPLHVCYSLHRASPPILDLSFSTFFSSTIPPPQPANINKYEQKQHGWKR